MGRGRGAIKGTAAVAAVAVAAAAGFIAAGLVIAGPSRLRERTPLAAARAMFGADVGHGANAPHELPAAGWWAILKRTAIRTAKNRLMAESAAVTFYTLLAIFPALTAIVSLYGIFADPAAITRLLDAVSDMMPGGAIDILRGQLQALIAKGTRGLTLGAGVGLVAALWSANQGSKALFEALNTVYREEEKRSYPLFVLQAFAFTIGAIVFVIAAMVAVVVLPLILHKLGMSEYGQELFRWLRWPLILLVVVVFLTNLYRFGPSRTNPKYRWVTWGGVLAALSWVAVSFAFSWYVQKFGSFDRTYGSLGAVVGFMFWIWLSTLVALIGAQLNSEMEHQTAVDTTTGTPRPLGLRGATQADTVA